VHRPSKDIYLTAAHLQLKLVYRDNQKPSCKPLENGGGQMIAEMRAFLAVFSVVLLIATWMSRHDTIQADSLAVLAPDHATGAVYYCGVGMIQCTTSKE
jgi:hypothetical protein